MRLAISSLGMLTAVGRDVVASCAAVRAGITCPSDLDALPVLDDDDEEPAILKGHAIRDYTADQYGGWQLVTFLQAGGGLFAQQLVAKAHYDMGNAKRLALEVAGIEGH